MSDYQLELHPPGNDKDTYFPDRVVTDGVHAVYAAMPIVRGALQSVLEAMAYDIEAVVFGGERLSILIDIGSDKSDVYFTVITPHTPQQQESNIIEFRQVSNEGSAAPEGETSQPQPADGSLHEAPPSNGKTESYTSDLRCPGCGQLYTCICPEEDYSPPSS